MVSEVTPSIISSHFPVIKQQWQQDPNSVAELRGQALLSPWSESGWAGMLDGDARRDIIIRSLVPSLSRRSSSKLEPSGRRWGGLQDLPRAPASDMDSLGFPSKGFSDVHRYHMDTTGCLSGSPYTSGSSWEKLAQVQYKHRYSHERNLQYLSTAHTFCPLPAAFGQEFRLTRISE